MSSLIVEIQLTMYLVGTGWVAGGARRLAKTNAEDRDDNEVLCMRVINALAPLFDPAQKYEFKEGTHGSWSMSLATSAVRKVLLRAGIFGVLSIDVAMRQPNSDDVREQIWEALTDAGIIADV